MFTFLDNKKGYAALIGLIVVILLIVVIIYGGSFFSGSSETSNPVDVGERAKDMIEDINDANEERAEKMDEEIRRSEGLGEFRIETNIESKQVMGSPVTIEGTVNKDVEELLIELKDEARNVKVTEKMTTKDTGEENTFSITLFFQFSGTKEGYLVITDTKDAKNFIEIPVTYKTEEN